MGDTLHNWTTILKMIKRITFLLLITIFSAQISSAQRGVRIGYIDMDVILESVDEYKTANLLLDKKVENWKKEIELQKRKEKDVNIE